MDDIVFRKATVKDIPFLVETIIEAEKAGTDILPYSTIFGLTEEEVKKYLIEMLDEEIDGCELSLSSFLVAEIDNVVIAASSAWVEGAEGLSSQIIKGNLLKYVLPRKAIQKAFSLNDIIHDLYFEYKKNTIHFGVGYVAEEYRGKGLFGKLKNLQISSLKKNGENISEAYVDIFGNNKAAIKANEKLGFKLVETKETDNKEILKILPSNKKILLKKILD